ncbi:MAG: TonB-dependent receptor [Candidatus Riflebacteria bacterium]|nr:TonB-dependent receptor [Candidatus Riflebacteria bacterium]
MKFRPTVSKRILAALFCLSTAFAGAQVDTQKTESFKLPDLAIDAERATYQGLISRPQDEISKEMIELKPTSNPVELLRAMNSSITMSHSLLGSIITPELRGFDGKHTKVMVDGCPVNTPWNSASSLSGFPLRRLQKATIIPGGQALVYGTNGIAGAVNLTLPTARDLEGLTFLQEAGGLGTRHQEFLYGRVAHQNEHLFGLFLDNYDGTRKYKTYGTGGNSSDNKMFMYRGRVETDNHWVFKATIMESRGNMSIPNYMEVFKPWEMSHQDFVVEKDFGNNRNLVLRYAKYRDYSATQFYTDYTLSVASGTIDPANDVTIEMRTMEALYNFPLGEKHYLTVGGQKQETRDIGHTVKAKASGQWLDTKGFFISDSITATDKLKFHLVARSDESYESDSETSWSTFADYQLSRRTSFGVGLSRTVRFPNVQELYRGSKVFGNEALEPEKSDNLEFRLSHQINNKWNTSVARFSSDIENKIISTTTTVATTIPGVGPLKAKDSYYINIDEAKISGWELNVNGKINDKFDAWVSYTRLDNAEDETNNIRLVSKPGYRVTLGTIFHQGKTSAMLSCEHQGVIPATVTVDSAGKATKFAEVDPSTCINLGVRQQVTKDCALYANVENLTDKDDIVLIQGSDSINKTGLLMDPIYYKDGRIFTFGAEVKF